MYAHTYIHMRAHTHRRTHPHVQTHVCTQTQDCIHTLRHTLTHVHAQTHMYTKRLHACTHGLHAMLRETFRSEQSGLRVLCWVTQVRLQPRQVAIPVTGRWLSLCVIRSRLRGPEGVSPGLSAPPRPKLAALCTHPGRTRDARGTRHSRPPPPWPLFVGVARAVVFPGPLLGSPPKRQLTQAQDCTSVPSPHMLQLGHVTDGTGWGRPLLPCSAACPCVTIMQDVSPQA